MLRPKARHAKPTLPPLRYRENNVLAYFYVHPRSLNQNAGAQELDKLQLACLIACTGACTVCVVDLGSVLPTGTHRVTVTSISRIVTICAPTFHINFPFESTLGRLSKSQWGCMDEINPCSLLQRAGGGGGSFLELGPFPGFLFRLLLSMPSRRYKVRSKFSMGCLIIWRGTLSTNTKPRLNAWLETLASPLWFCWVGKVSGLASWMRDGGISSCRAETLSSQRKPLSHSSWCPH